MADPNLIITPKKRRGYCHAPVHERPRRGPGSHRTLKAEEVYWRLYDNPADARACLAEFEARCNQRRPPWALVPESGGDPVTP